ncbi:hypothetical protein [Paraburkholderia sp.]|uniref:hypothetical protein n=1 Tax=Paraburkholderia sp. TaxID=1926495 RepID=UPI002D7FAD00|nr:hypothetical protein [Paraburkholderia sp.]
MQLQIQFPDTFALHGVERDAFEAKLRDAPHDVCDGSRVRQLAEQVDARRPFEPSDVRALRRMVMHAIGARLGLDLAEPGIAADTVGQNKDATNRLEPNIPLTPRRRRGSFLAPAIAAGMAVGVLATATTLRKIAHPAATAPMVATVVSMSPAQTLRDLASGVPDGGRLYRVPVRVELQGTDAGSH